MTDRLICRRCGASTRQRGVHFVISDAATGTCLSTYDVCMLCMKQHSPLIIPREAMKPGVSQVSISYASFGESDVETKESAS
jgi:hypothetical protein